MKVIVDLDGTISDDRHRKHLIDDTDAGYAAYHAQFGKDRFMNPGIIHIGRLTEGIVFVTARPVEFLSNTCKWIDTYLPIMSEYQLLMRPAGDRSPSWVVKMNLITKHLQGTPIACAFDDRVSVLEAYRTLNIPGVLVGYDSYHNEPAATIPDLLRKGAETFEQRNKTYGQTYEIFGEVMAKLFPNGLTIKPGDVDHFNLLGIYTQIITKAARYAASLSKGEGHVDSAHDGMVYNAMLEYLTRKL